MTAAQFGAGLFRMALAGRSRPFAEQLDVALTGLSAALRTMPPLFERDDALEADDATLAFTHWVLSRAHSGLVTFTERLGTRCQAFAAELKRRTDDREVCN